VDVVQSYNSVCRGCHGGCGVVLHVKDDKLVKVKGNPASPLNHGRLCPIGNAVPDLVHHPDRLKYPLGRKGARGSGQWQRISWDDALGEMAEKLNNIRATDGAHTIVMGTGTGRHHAAWVSRFGHAMGTPNWCEPGFALRELAREVRDLTQKLRGGVRSGKREADLADKYIPDPTARNEHERPGPR